MSDPQSRGPASRLQRLPWLVLIVGSLTLGLAPFSPEPHLVEKLRMLVAGDLSRPIDIFDLVLHGLFPALLALKVVHGVFLARGRGG